jgi:hypothetical protein
VLSFRSPPPCARFPRKRCKRSAQRAKRASASTVPWTLRAASPTTRAPSTASCAAFGTRTPRGRRCLRAARSICRRSAIGSTLDGIIREQAQLLADVQLAASSPDAAVAGSEASRCLLTAVARAPLPPPPGAGGGRFEAAAADGVRVRRLGRVVEGGARAVLRRAGGVSAAGAGFLRALGGKGGGNGQFQNPVCCALDDQGNLVVSDWNRPNHRIQVLRYSDGAHLRTSGSQGLGNGQFSSPHGFAFDGAGHILVADYSNHRVQMLRYSDSAHVRTIGSQGSGNSQFSSPQKCRRGWIGAFGRVRVRWQSRASSRMTAVSSKWRHLRTHP